MNSYEIEINKTIIAGRKFKRLNNDETRNWDRISWTILCSSNIFKDQIKKNHPRLYKRKDT